MIEGAFTVSSEVSDSINDVLVRGLTEHSLEAGVPPYAEDKKDLYVIFRDETGNVVGGVSGETFRNWFHIIRTWVAKDVRGKGIGSKLMAQAEAEAARRGCHSAYGYSGSFQAPDFYKKLGYKEFVVMNDFPIGHQRIGFMKRLAA